VVDAQGRFVVLIVEDEPSYQEALSVGLSAEGFVVACAGTIASARPIVEDLNPDVILLDVMLPDGSGVDFCRELTSRRNTPVIMVSARSSELDIVLGLEIGATDYITKPYRLRELVARIRAVLRQPPGGRPSDIIEFGPWRLDGPRRMLMKNGETVDLSRKEFDLLTLLASRMGQVVTREVCLDTLWWGLDLVDSRSLDTHIKRLRHKIEDDPATPTHLITIRGVGYRLDA
jgi:two-component system response regulator RegX3